MLRRLGANTHIDSVKWRQKDIITSCVKKINIRSFNMLERILGTYVKNRDQNISGGFFKLGMIIGDSPEAPGKDVDRLWDRMTDKYGTDKYGIEAIKKTLGTLLMILIAEDTRNWVWEPDPEKIERQIRGEKPEGNIYYKDPNCKKNSIDDLVNKYKKCP